MGKRSVATIQSPEFLNITSISPLISKCEIKVLYVGQNRNKTFITKEVAAKMAETLPGCPIVGYYTENKQDFLNHGEQIIIDGEGVKFRDLTRPYGFIAPNTRIWFKEFEDTDEFGNIEYREYLMTEGYLWTGQYKECKRVIEEGNPHSMKLEKDSLKGYWSNDKNLGIDFFIINDATFENLCILGEDVEPCFEGSEITAPNISASFSKDSSTIVHTLFSMMSELKETLQNKGGYNMTKNEELKSTTDTNAEASPSADFAEESTVPVSEAQTDTPATENFSENLDNSNKSTSAENQDTMKDFANSSDDKKEEESEDNSDKEDKKKFELLEQKYSELQKEYSDLEKQYQTLVEFKNTVENEKKDELINSFYMLSDEDKKDVVENKAIYSLEEIKAKLATIGFEKKVNFACEVKPQKAEAQKETSLTYNLGTAGEDSLPAWLKAVQETKNKMK